MPKDQKGLVESGQQNGVPIQPRISESTDSVRSVVESGSLNGSILAHSCQSTESVLGSQDKENDFQLEDGDGPDESIVGLQDQTGRTRPLDEVGARSSSPATEIRAEEPTLESVRQLRPSELCRLLNSTPMGEVISERQLYRHRTRSGNRFCTDRRIDLVRYIDWLMEQRQRRLAQRPWHQQVGSIGSGNNRANIQFLNPDSPVTAHMILALLEKQRFRCALSGRKLTPENVALDHIIPISRGGGHNVGNAQAITKDANRAKGVLTNEEFILICRDVVRFADSKPPREDNADSKQAH